MKLILHFGIHRTGSTGIHNYLSQNHDSISKEGFLYPIIDGQRLHGKLPYALESGKVSTSDLLKQIERQSSRRTHTVIISSENFASLKNFSFLSPLKEKYDVQLLDCDVEEPNDHIFMKPAITSCDMVSIPVPKVDEGKCTYCGKCAEICAYNAIAVVKQKILVFPELCHGCGACSYLCPEEAITEVGKEIGIVESGNSDGIGFVHGRLSIGQPMAPPIIRKVIEHVNHNGAVIIDALLEQANGTCNVVWNENIAAMSGAGGGLGSVLGGWSDFHRDWE